MLIQSKVSNLRSVPVFLQSDPLFVQSSVSSLLRSPNLNFPVNPFTSWHPFSPGRFFTVQSVERAFNAPPVYQLLILCQKLVRFEPDTFLPVLVYQIWTPWLIWSKVGPFGAGVLFSPMPDVRYRNRRSFSIHPPNLCLSSWSNQNLASFDSGPVYISIRPDVNLFRWTSVPHTST